MNLSLTLSSRAAYLLVIHGSRDPRPAVAAQTLAQRVADCLTQTSSGHSLDSRLQSDGGLHKTFPPVLVETAYLELAPTPLHQQIVEFGDRALQYGYSRLIIVPLFLLPGVHVRDDIPKEVTIAQLILNQSSSSSHLPSISRHIFPKSNPLWASSRQLALSYAHRPKMDVFICPYLGSAPKMIDVLAKRILDMGGAEKIATSTQTPRFSTQSLPTILLAHGSRRTGGNQPIEAIATQLGVYPAYWSVSPGLDDQIQKISQQGHNHILVIPYFLFVGGITDAITQRVDEIRERHPHLTLTLGHPLGVKDDVVHLIIDLVETTQQDLQLSA